MIYRVFPVCYQLYFYDRFLPDLIKGSGYIKKRPFSMPLTGYFSLKYYLRVSGYQKVASNAFNEPELTQGVCDIKLALFYLG